MEKKRDRESSRSILSVGEREIVDLVGEREIGRVEIYLECWRKRDRESSRSILSLLEKER